MASETKKPGVGDVVLFQHPFQYGAVPALVVGIEKPDEQPNVVNLQIFGNWPGATQFERNAAFAEEAKSGTWRWPS